eukprot:3873550-Amphidinium_carterae.2
MWTTRMVLPPWVNMLPPEAAIRVTNQHGEQPNKDEHVTHGCHGSWDRRNEDEISHADSCKAATAIKMTSK